MKPGTRSAAAFIRHAVAKSGAIVAGHYGMSTWTTSVIDELERHGGAWGHCEHVDVTTEGAVLDAEGQPTAVVMRTAGPMAFVAQCPNCWSGPDDCCDGCDRSMTFGRRLVLTPPRPAHAYVLAAVLCRDCRKGRL